MLAAQHTTPVSEAHHLRPKSGRTPLQPKNFPANPELNLPTTKSKARPQQEWFEITPLSASNKESHPTSAKPTALQPIDASLAEELSAIKKKLERLRLERERTERMLKERDSFLELQMKELLERGEVQKELEMEVDRLYRLNELRSFCMRVSPIRTLREREQKKKTNEEQTPEIKVEDGEESVDESLSQKLSPASSKIVTENS